jgi:LmbE family N-acetylglucosaminyl deacetylase
MRADSIGREHPVRPQAVPDGTAGKTATPRRPAEVNAERCVACRVAVIVAHPDDETLWAGGLLLSHPEWSPFIVSLCRGGDPDRAPKFARVLELLHAEGAMGDLDDGPEQTPLPGPLVEETILSLLPRKDYDILLTHAPKGEYTRHRRHEEVSRAVLDLWRRGHLHAGELLQFAYEDGGGVYSPRPRKDAPLHLYLPGSIWARKHDIITDVYGFGADSWEARAVTHTEAFHCYSDQASRSC